LWEINQTAKLESTSSTAAAAFICQDHAKEFLAG
jgi:hypothetical protein